MGENWKSSNLVETDGGGERGDEPLIYVELGRKRNYVAIQKRGGRGGRRYITSSRSESAACIRVCVCARVFRGGGRGREVDARAHVEAIGVPC